MALADRDAELIRLMEGLRAIGRRMEAETPLYIRRAYAAALGHDLDGEPVRRRNRSGDLGASATDRVGAMRTRQLIQKNLEVIEECKNASLRLAEAADRQARACSNQSDVLRVQIAELQEFGEQLARRTDALMDSFSMLARDLRRDET